MTAIQDCIFFLKDGRRALTERQYAKAIRRLGWAVDGLQHAKAPYLLRLDAHLNFAKALLGEHHDEKARQQLYRSIRLILQQSGGHIRHLVTTLASLATVWRRGYEFGRALVVLDLTLDVLRHYAPGEPNLRPGILQMIAETVDAMTYATARGPDPTVRGVPGFTSEDAVGFAQMARREIEQSNPEDAFALSTAMYEIGLLHKRANRLDRAIEAFWSSISRARSTLPAEHPWFALPLDNLADCAARQYRLDDYLALREGANRRLSLLLRQPNRDISEEISLALSVLQDEYVFLFDIPEPALVDLDQPFVHSLRPSVDPRDIASRISIILRWSDKPDLAQLIEF